MITEHQKAPFQQFYIGATPAQQQELDDWIEQAYISAYWRSYNEKLAKMTPEERKKEENKGMWFQHVFVIWIISCAMTPLVLLGYGIYSNFVPTETTEEVRTY